MRKERELTIRENLKDARFHLLNSVLSLQAEGMEEEAKKLLNIADRLGKFENKVLG